MRSILFSLVVFEAPAAMKLCQSIRWDELLPVSHANLLWPGERAGNAFGDPKPRQEILRQTRWEMIFDCIRGGATLACGG